MPSQYLDIYIECTGVYYHIILYVLYKLRLLLNSYYSRHCQISLPFNYLQISYLHFSECILKAKNYFKYHFYSLGPGKKNFGSGQLIFENLSGGPVDPFLFFLNHRINILNLRPKKLIICFSGTARVTFNPPAPKIFIAFPVFILKNRLYIANCQFRSAVICRHFVCWLAGAHTKSRNFFRILLGYIVL